MLERVIENWLDKAAERSFQKPFCFMLSAKGYTLVHLTRHTGMEMGKDVIAIAPDGVACAYQLKGAKNGKITLRQWDKEISDQAFKLVTTSIVHPSIGRSKHHRSYLVTNGELEEEVIRVIDDRNRLFANSGQPQFKLETIVKGQLFKWAKELETNLWPTDLENMKNLLELFLEDGSGNLPKGKLASLFEATLPFKGKTPSKAQSARIIASAAVLNSVAISSFSNSKNHVAEMEAWILYLSYLLAFVEKWNLTQNIWKTELQIAIDFIYNFLSDLCDEIRERKHLVQGDPFTEPFHFYRVRITYLIALMSIFAFWRLKKQLQGREVDDFIRDFCLTNKSKLLLWGEAAIPQFLAFYWYFRKIDGTSAPDFHLRSIIELICKQNQPGSKNSVANPYFEAIDILPHVLGIAEEPIEDSFDGNSYYLEGLVQLYVRRNYKQRMKFLWPDYTKICNRTFKPQRKWHFYRWKNREGTELGQYPKPKQDWRELQKMSNESKGKGIPTSIKKYTILLLLFLCVYPHRVSSGLIRFLDTKIDEI